MGHVLWHLGFPDQALRRLQRGIDEAVELRHVPTQAFACFQTVYHHGPLMRNDVDGVASALTQYRQLVGDRDFLTWSTVMRSAEAWLRSERGHCEGVLEEIRQNIEWWKNNAGKLVVPWLLILQASAQDRAGRSDGALHSVDEAMGWVERFGERWQLAEICRYKGELMARSQGSESAGQGDCYRKALEIARDQSSLAFELRAATSLARLWADQGNCEDAHDLLAPVYSRFGEGFQTSDLKAAATLLATLSLDQEGRG
jgi:predicted ATPase